MNVTLCSCIPAVTCSFHAERVTEIQRMTSKGSNLDYIAPNGEVKFVSIIFKKISFYTSQK
jgi:hypothetical protein